MKISVISPTLNNGDALRRTIESFLAQDYPDKELVVVDGGSNDGTEVLLERVVAEYPQMVKNINGIGGGVYNAVNKGVSASSGDVVAVLHGNDVYTSPTALSRMMGVLDKYPEVPYVYGDVHYVDTKGRIVRRYHGDEDIATSLMHGIAPPHPSLFIRRSMCDKVGEYDLNYKVAADFEYFTRLVFNHNFKGQYVPGDVVEMSTGGLSGKLYNRLIVNSSEKIRALRQAGVARYGGYGVLLRYFRMK